MLCDGQIAIVTGAAGNGMDRSKLSLLSEKTPALL